jgi:hypothetical protein
MKEREEETQVSVKEVNKKSKTISLNPAIRLVEKLNLIVGLRSDGNVNLFMLEWAIPSLCVHVGMGYTSLC